MNTQPAPNSRDHPDLVEAMKDSDSAAKELLDYREKRTKAARVGTLEDDPPIIESSLIKKGRAAKARVEELRKKYGFSV